MKFSEVFCISLPGRSDRREHAVGEFGRLGLAFRWIDAFDSQSEAVRRAFRAGRVASFPPCFRCGADRCACENRRLMPEQVGTWLSHEQAWRRVAAEGLTLVCEDDVKFTERAAEGLAWLATQAPLASALRRGEALLVRLGRALGPNHASEAAFVLNRRPTMSNPCYALNRPMANLLLERSDRIGTTVDIYTHRDVATGASHFTLEPPLAYELSWSTGELRSDIRPKQVYIDRLEARLETLQEGTPEHETVRKAIADERERFRAFHAYNAPGQDED
jgi:GR25 family glycosyltransferase involved in LPS biosynthesis